MLDPVVVGWDRARSADLVRTLLTEATRPECQVRLSWSVGDVALWDNRVLLHYGVRDYGAFPRELERVLIARPSTFIEELV
ncbi:Alpha-ketoglutarate-dependent sulfate ester dioxygenase (fragment) [Frankia canadensis]|uniref:Alpha-ketoglutarate-dependent sulfate ester dioxygenase n=2 Tax=Frankia canadensis TaxID=1836972 RepID=A0A2I2KLH8_9ACTN